MSSRNGVIILLMMWIVPVASVMTMTEAGLGLFTRIGWVEEVDRRGWIVYPARQLALGYGYGRERRAVLRRRARQGKRQQEQPGVIDWELLRPALGEVLQVEEKPDAGGVSSFRLPVQVIVVTPDYSQTICRQCGGPTQCKRTYYIHPQDIDLAQPTVLQVYREVRECCNQKCKARIAPELDFVEKDGRFTKRTKQKAIASVVEDGMPLGRVPQRMWRDFHVRVAQSTVYEWVHAEAEADLGKAEYTQWVAARFSGVIGLDEVHLQDKDGKKQYLMVAVDPINERTILFDLVNSRDGDAIKDFLERLKEMGIDPLVVITDMWKAYHSALLDVFPEAAHQLCVFHVIQAVMKHTNQALLTYRRGLPQETEEQRAIRKELWQHRYLLLKTNRKLSDDQRRQLRGILKKHQGTVLPTAYCCKELILALFRKSRNKEDARKRRDAILNQFGDVPELEKVLNVIRGDDFELMCVYLDYENLDKTNNHAERENRVYQKGEKVRYRARTTDTRLNYVRLRARQRNQHSAERNDRLSRRSKLQIMNLSGCLAPTDSSPLPGVRCYSHASRRNGHSPDSRTYFNRRTPHGFSRPLDPSFAFLMCWNYNRTVSKRRLPRWLRMACRWGGYRNGCGATSMCG
jgi:transposase-like protein